MKYKTSFISIIIPTYNRPQQLRSCLESLTKLDYPQQSFEVIVVDDGSKTPLDTVVAPFKSQLKLNLVRIENSGPGNARNQGAKVARGQYLAFTDDDCTPSSDWLKNIAAGFTSTPNCLIGGKTLNALPHNPYSTASQELIEYLYSYYHTNNIKQASFFASNNFALSKEQFCKLGGFDVSLTVASEDREFCDRWLAAGYPMIYAPEVNVYHAHDLTLASFWRQHFNYGRGAFNFQQVRTKRKVEPIKVEPSSFYLNLFSYPFSKTIEQPKLLVSSLFFLSQLAGATGFFWERFNQSFGFKYAQ